MAWVRLDDQFTDHPKVVAAGPLAAWLYVCGLTYCARHLTDGLIPVAQVRQMAASGAGKLAAALVAVGLWEEAPGGYRVHDYLEYNPTRAQVLALRQQRAVAGQRGGQQKASKLLASRQAAANDNVVANGYPVPHVPTPGHHASQHVEHLPLEESSGAVDTFAPGGAETSSAGPKKRRPTGPHHALFEALVARFGTPANRAEGGRLGKAATLLLEASVAPDEVAALADACVVRWGAGACTPLSLASNVTALRTPAPTASSGQERYFADYRSSAEKAINPVRQWRQTYNPDAPLTSDGATA